MKPLPRELGAQLANEDYPWVPPWLSVGLSRVFALALISRLLGSPLYKPPKYVRYGRLLSRRFWFGILPRALLQGFRQFEVLVESESHGLQTPLNC
jgi:hypothetical protein